MHTPVLLREVLEVLNPEPGQLFIDATVNGGGHAREIAKRVGEKGKVIGIDRDCDIIRETKIKNHALGIKNMPLICDRYTRIRDIARAHGLPRVHGVLFDLGFSSYHIDRSGRGFSFLKDEPLDMRYNRSERGASAADIVNTYTEKELADIFTRYGEERFARRIARAIAAGRSREKILTSRRLADIVCRVPANRARRQRIHPATRVFQALRIAVNDELSSLAAALPAALSLLAPGGAIAVIAFHSLEDRTVKTFLRNQERIGAARIITRHPVRPSREEIRGNPRSSPARLRAAVKI